MTTSWTSRALQLVALFALLLCRLSSAYQVEITDGDETRQVCSGMWGRPGIRGRREPWIEVLFGPASRGAAALVIYEWTDAMYLGIASDGTGAGDNSWEDERVYICTLAAQQAGLCAESALGQFIVSMPNGTSIASTSIFTAPVLFETLGDGGSANATGPRGSPGPFRYNVTRTGYYCVGTVPVSIGTTGTATGGEEYNPFDGSVAFNGVVDFENVFEGHLPASEYPKIPFYLTMAIVYTGIGLVWGVLCWRNRNEILGIQHYVSATIAFIVVEMFALYGYWSYLNASGTQRLSKPLLVLVSVLNAARNSISFFMLCIVCMGYGIVRPSLGSVMLRVRILAVVHFAFGVLYSIGTVTIPLEDAGMFLLFCVMPLAVSLTAFMMWIMWSLNATIVDLDTRKQTYKKQMFVRLHRILLAAAIVIIAFFVISSISFSSRLDEDYAPDTWQTRFFLLDGWLGLLYLAVFCAIAWLWRPTPHNRRLAMSDELAMEDDEADYEVATMDRARLHDDAGRDDYHEGDAEAFPMKVARKGGVGEDDVVFDIGEDDDEESAIPRRKRDSDEEEGRESGERERLFDEEEGGGRGRPPSYQ